MLSDACVSSIKRLTSVRNLRPRVVVVKFGQADMMLLAGKPMYYLAEELARS